MDGVQRLLPAPLSTYFARRVCLIKPSSLGDVVQALPVLAALRARYPRAHIAWVVNRAYAPLLRPIPILDEVIEFDRDEYRGQGARRWGRFARFLRELRDREFDLAIDLQGLFRSGAMCWATRAGKRVGLATAREGASLFYTDWADDRPIWQNAVDRYWNVAKLLGVGDLPREFPLALRSEERSAAERLLADYRRPILALSPGARWATKRWPAERFAEAAERTLAPRGGSVVIVGAADEEAFALDVSLRLRRPTLNLCGKTTLRELAAVLQQVDLLLTNDSGPMHLAAAIGAPTVSIFTCTSPERAAPFGAGHRVIQTTVGCKSSYLRRCEKMDCMKELTTATILPILNEAIDALPPPVHACSRRAA